MMTEGKAMDQEALEALTEQFLDQVAEWFDAGMPITPDSTFINADGSETTAGRMFELVRLGK
jgi:hypothetical protein